MPTDATNHLLLLPQMSKSKLRALWKQLVGDNAPDQLRRGLLVQLLAYRIQEQASGGLSAATSKRLRELGRKLAAKPNSDVVSVRRIKPGTRLIRQWRGRVHQVTVLERGFQYEDRKYPSLSEIARAITGTRWSGPMFFGLKANNREGRPNA